MKKRTLWILGAIVLIAIPTSYFAYAATLGVRSSKVTVHRQGATISVPSPSPTAQTPSSSPTPAPSDSAPASKTCTITATGDATVDQNADRTAGPSGDLIVRSEKNKNKRVFLQFDIASCSIPTTANVSSAGLQLTTATAPATSRTYVMNAVTGGAWAESTVAWRGQPAAGGATISASSGAAGSTVSWAVTAHVKSVVAGTASNFGWRLSDSSEGTPTSTSFSEGSFRSREFSTAAVRPTLVINYTS